MNRAPAVPVRFLTVPGLNARARASGSIVAGVIMGNARAFASKSLDREGTVAA